MNDFEIDQIMHMGPRQDAHSAFEDKVLQESTHAFRRGHTLRKCARKAVLIAFVLFVAGIGFLGGRLSVRPETSGNRQFVQSIADKSSPVEWYSLDTAQSADSAQWYGYTDDSGDQWLIEGVRVVPASFN